MAGDGDRPTQLGSIREIHRAHELRTADARLIRRARVAIADRSIRKADVAPLLQRCGARMVRGADEATIVVAASEDAVKRGKQRGSGVQRVVDEAGLRALVAAYESVYLPPALREAARRARQRLAAEVMGAQLARDQRRKPAPTRQRGGRRAEQQPEPAPSSRLTEAERQLQEHVRGLRAKGASGPLVRQR